MRKSTKQKLIVIGFDSGTFTVLNELRKTNSIPTITKLMDSGVTAVLESTIPPITPCAWESAVTGVNPGKHNIFDFFSYRSDYGIDVLTSSDRSAMAVWDYAGYAGKKSIVFNYPMGFPPKKIEGIFVSGMNTPGINTEFTHPSSIKKEILKKAPSYRIDVLGDHLINGREDLYFEEVMDLTKSHFTAVRHLMKKYDWDLSLIFFSELDRIHHYFYHDIDPDHPFRKEGKASRKDRMMTYYKLLDSIMKELIETYKEASFLLFSDHGTAPLHKDIFIESYLEDWGFLKRKKTYKGFFSSLIPFSVLLARKLVYSLGIANFAFRIVPGNIFSLLVRLSSSDGMERQTFDWSKTKVYFPTPSSQGLRINLKGREVEGIVTEKEYDKVRDAVIKKIYSMKDPQTGENIVKHVHKREEIYTGAYVQNAQDLIVETYSTYHLQKGGGVQKSGLASEGGVLKSAEHSREGMFIFWKNRGKHKVINKIPIVAIAPIILYILGLPIPKVVEGSVPEELILYERQKK